MSRFTPEQTAAIERRTGRLLLDAGAGSGKTAVLVERFARAVEEDGVDPGQILAITFTEKAATEMRERVRARLALVEDPAWILTIHGLCARLLRAHALGAGLDPAFTVLEEDGARELADAAFGAALEAVGATAAGRELFATHAVGAVRAAVLSAYGELRARGERHPRLPVVPSPTAGTTATRLRALAAAVCAELGEIADPGVTICAALDGLGAGRFESDWPDDLPDLKGNANALKTDACAAYRAALTERREYLAAVIGARTRDGLDALLDAYGRHYAAAKRRRGAVDFDDLELLALERLEAVPAPPFAHVMVDELQDTNAVQLALVDALAAGGAALFMVGDAQQAIYGFRHADVALFRARGRALAADGGRLALRTNFRTRAEVLEVINAGFDGVIDDFMALAPGRADPPSEAPLVELIVTDKTGRFAEDDGLATPWRVAEARALAARVAGLIGAGAHRAADVVVLTRATTDLHVYERALEAAGVPTFVIGGRGLWQHPQVVLFVAYLQALANPLEQEAFYTVLASPLCGLSLDGLVRLAAGAEDALELEDAGRLARFERFFAAERLAARRIGPERLIDRVLEWSGYERELAARPDGRRRLANVRKLMRLGREWEAAHGADLPGFVALLARRGGAGAREAEAPLDAEAVDAVRLMTIHRSKGLEFPVVCVADLGRGPARSGGLVLLADDGRLGLRIGRPGAEGTREALAYGELREAAAVRERAEQKRLFYVAMTRARERLILSGARKFGTDPRADTLTPIEWIVPAFGGLDGVTVTELADEAALPVPAARPQASTPAPGVAPAEGVAPAGPAAPTPPSPPPVAVRPAVESLSYSALADHARCGYRFYAERILGMASVGAAATGARQHGIEVHARLAAGDDAGFDWNETFARVRGLRAPRREQPFAFGLDGTLMTGVFDVIGAESDRCLVVDYKTDGLRGRDPEAIVLAEYRLQRALYGLAALRTGIARVEVVHLFLEDVHAPAAVVYEATDRPALEAELGAAVAPVVAGEFAITRTPGAGVCTGCPAAGTLCPVPADVRTR